MLAVCLVQTQAVVTWCLTMGIPRKCKSVHVCLTNDNTSVTLLLYPKFKTPSCLQAAAISPFTPKAVICNFWHPGTLTLSPSARVPGCQKLQFTNDGLTWSGTGCFMAKVRICQKWALKGHKPYTTSIDTFVAGITPRENKLTSEGREGWCVTTQRQGYVTVHLLTNQHFTSAVQYTRVWRGIRGPSLPPRKKLNLDFGIGGDAISRCLEWRYLHSS